MVFMVVKRMQSSKDLLWFLLVMFQKAARVSNQSRCKVKQREAKAEN